MQQNIMGREEVRREQRSPLRLLRDLRWLRQAWWRDLKKGRRRSEPSVKLDPFDFWRDEASAFPGLGGSNPSTAPGYAFHTRYIPSTGGTMSFTLRLPGLRATRGTLTLIITAVSDNPRLKKARQKIKKIDLATFAERGGEVRIKRFCLPYCSYALMGLLDSSSDAHVDDVRITVTGADDREAMLERLEVARKGFLSEPGTGRLAHLVSHNRATLDHPISQMCTAHQMGEHIYHKWCARIGLAPTRHRKQWEFIFILRTLQYYGALQKGARGLGFGVGMEPLSSLFASINCKVVATDLPVSDERATLWDKTDQLGDIKRIYHPDICDEDLFFKNVTFRPVDMTDIPADLRDFDFTWSSCAYEHLGSIKAGLEFVENSIDCLKPGGLAVHTTELNLSSNDDTLDKTTTVLFRRRDFEELALRLLDQGHEVMPITFDSGDDRLDRYIDLPPYASDPHLKLALMRWVSTSFGMIVRKAM